MKRRVITERTIRDAARSGKALEIGPDDLVTPAARDAASALGVALNAQGPAPAPPAPPAPPASFVVALGSDHGGFRLKESLKTAIKELGLEHNDVGCPGTEAVDYPIYAAHVADLVASGGARFGIMVDGAGIGSAMVANKIAGVRAALCYDLTTARNAREHNDANVLTLGGGLIGERLAADIAQVFLTTPFGGDRHARRVAMINALDTRRT
ncbi:MAG: RpiB/LacA/LacB family sugar-phosphate isomerase [Gemmatimonadetes bacterium]|nr:RpiB/LacA/LacB family sugar-phosphate isomerase [Gemmatimonadota bacterium]